MESEKINKTQEIESKKTAIKYIFILEKWDQGMDF